MRWAVSDLAMKDDAVLEFIALGFAVPFDVLC